ncbi:MAG: hypothetical protein ABI720_02790 [Actinomycetes bacterium]
MSIQSLEHAAATAAWVSAALRGVCSVEQTLDVINGLDGPSPLTDFVPHDESEPIALAFAIARWRRQGVPGWRYLPVAPGDAAGLPGPARFSTSVLDRGVGLLAAGSESLGLVTEVSEPGLVWREYQTDSTVLASVVSASEAERQLLDALNGSVDLLNRLDLSDWRPNTSDVRHEWFDPTPMPAGTGHRAERLALRSRRILQVVEVATVDDGGSRTLTEMQARGATLTELARTARQAHAAAWNTPLHEATERR